MSCDQDSMQCEYKSLSLIHTNLGDLKQTMTKEGDFFS